MKLEVSLNGDIKKNDKTSTSSHVVHVIDTWYTSFKTECTSIMLRGIALFESEMNSSAGTHSNEI